MDIQFTSVEMMQLIVNHFKERGFNVDTWSDDFLPARVPIYCEKNEDDIVTLVVIDFTTDNIITEDIFFPLITVDKVRIHDSSVRFYQYFFPKANIFFAYPYYVEKNDEFNDFIKVCKRNGIGLIEVLEDSVKEVVNSIPMLSIICKRLNIEDGKENELEYHLRNCLHYFVYYPKPIFKKRAITGRVEDKMSFVIIDKLTNLKNIVYKDKLIKLASEYRKESRDDYEIAESYISDLWLTHLGLEYPKIQRRVENILQRDEMYRDHYVHQFQVFLIGAYILDKINKFVSKEYEEKYECKIENAWLAASTFHDFSYGLQNFDTWLMQYFNDVLGVKYEQTKENLNILNLDAAMIREELYNKIIKMVDALNNNGDHQKRELLIRYFYEKAVRDRNHSVLSAISFLKLYEEGDKSKIKINISCIIDAALAICCHDEDIWEALCGCQGYRRSPGSLPKEENICLDKCGRNMLLWPEKQSRIFKEHLSMFAFKDFNDKVSCENWEKEIMNKQIIKKITLKDFPILFLLILCDSVQDEGRITSVEQKIGRERSMINEVKINLNEKTYKIDIKLQSNQYDKKEAEIERVSWCLKDKKYSVHINNNVFEMNGSGGR